VTASFVGLGWWVFDYELPPARIAQFPCPQRDQAQLLVVRRATGTLAHHRFGDLPTLLAPGDLLVLNDTRVVPARLLGHRERTGGSWEGLFLRPDDQGRWVMLCQTRGRLVEGETVTVMPGPLRLTLVGRSAEGHFVFVPDQPGTAEDLLQQHGRIPLPPYIRKGQADASDSERYQTVYAQHTGSVAAPTAGLHFTPDLFARLHAHGIERATVTLHVGLGTFAPIKAADVNQHVMHREWCSVPAATVQAIRACRARGNRVIAVGTTTTRTLESAARNGELVPWAGETDLFIRPPFVFRAIDALITNFHLPRTTLLYLVGALAGAELLQHAYQTALAHEYRFFSYGDAMVIL
jgi:S-adenosylmethionine:tRNA ribosyltransferase-isomerase